MLIADKDRGKRVIVFHEGKGLWEPSVFGWKLLDIRDGEAVLVRQEGYSVYEYILPANSVRVIDE